MYGPQEFLRSAQKNLKEVIKGWLIVSIKKGLSIPQLGGLVVEDVKGATR